jgi:hypothetical protein
MVLAAGVAACGDHGGTNLAANPPVEALSQWTFADPTSASAWQLEADPGASAAVAQGELALRSAMLQVDGQARCPVAAAVVPLTDAKILNGSLTQLDIELQVTRWDLGLGRFDTDVPRLELTLKGQRYRIGVEGFKKMPGTVRFQWTSPSGLTSQYDGVTSTRGAEVTPDSGPPRLRLWIDGCSQGMSQALAIRQVVVSGR